MKFSTDLQKMNHIDCGDPFEFSSRATSCHLCFCVKCLETTGCVAMESSPRDEL